MLCRSFDFICAEDARVLIVGTMPSVKSLERAQYYGHPRNAFWPILFEAFGEAYRDDYAVKQALIRAHGLALWDAAACCEREGSLDSDMRGVVYNDFGALYRVCPHIHTVLCNGGMAHTLFQRSGYAGNLRVVRMPSTSPAYTLSYAKKREAWKTALLDALSREEADPLAR